MDLDSMLFGVAGAVILETMETSTKSGYSYSGVVDLFNDLKVKLPFSEFQEGVKALLSADLLHMEPGYKIYLAHEHRYEMALAEKLTEILMEENWPHWEKKIPHEAKGVKLSKEQQEAVLIAMNHHLSMILGGAGTGKTTLIKAILDCCEEEHTVLCAPTGKAAQNLTDRVGFQAATVHAVLGTIADGDFLAGDAWHDVKTVIVDEAGMLSQGMLAGILKKVPKGCRVILVGDPNQLKAVGAGSILSDLKYLGVPYKELFGMHRQSDSESALSGNLRAFPRLHVNELLYDDSFCFVMEHDPQKIQEMIVREALNCNRMGEEWQVLSPYKGRGPLSAEELSKAIRAERNGTREQVQPAFVEGDRVMICCNDRTRKCWNGDTGVLHFKRGGSFEVELDDGRKIQWPAMKDLGFLRLGFAITVHKAQGSEYDTVLMPVVRSMENMLNRELLYTAISRARKRVILIGEYDVFERAKWRSQPERRTALVERVQKAMQKKGECA